MLDTIPTWALAKYSIRVVVNGPAGVSGWTTRVPFEATPERAQEMVDDFERKLQSYCVSVGSQPLSGLVLYTRWNGPRSTGAEKYEVCVSEYLVPPQVLLTSCTSYELFKHV